MFARKRPKFGMKNEKSHAPSASSRGLTLGRFPIRSLAMRRVSSGINSGRFEKTAETMRPFTRTSGERMGERKMSLTFSADLTSRAIKSLVGGRGGLAVNREAESVKEGVVIRCQSGHLGYRIESQIRLYVHERTNVGAGSQRHPFRLVVHSGTNPITRTNLGRRKRSGHRRGPQI